MSADANHMIKIWQEGICSSDTPSFNSLFRFYYAHLVRFAIQFVHTREAAEEIVSDIQPGTTVDLTTEESGCMLIEAAGLLNKNKQL